MRSPFGTNLRSRSTGIQLIVGALWFAVCIDAVRIVLAGNEATRRLGSEAGALLVMATFASAQAVAICRSERRHKLLDRQEGLVTLANRALDALPEYELLSDAAELAAQVLDAQIAFIFELVADVDGPYLQCAAQVGTTMASSRVPVSPDSQASYVMTNPTGYTVINDYDRPLPFVPAAAFLAAGVTNSISSRMGNASEPFGVISAHRTTHRPFDDSDRVFLCQLANIVAIVFERRRHANQLSEQLRHDSLTGLMNRRAFVERMSRTPLPGALLAVDIDRFNAINDTYGHEVGDEVLCIAAKRIASFAGNDDLVARIGGDEFIIVLAGEPTVAETMSRARRLLAHLSTTVKTRDHQISMSATVGIAHATQGHDLARNADIALFAGSLGGGGRVVLFDKALHDALTKRRDLTRRLAGAITDDALTLMYQPVMSLRTGRPLRVEALCRWTDPELGAIAPDVFIPLAEQSALIGPLGRLVIRRALRDLRQIRRCAPDQSIGVSVNLSPRQLEDPELVDYVAETLLMEGIDAEGIEFELTEHALARHSRALDELHRLRALGVSISIDDFGTAESSLSRLHELPVDVLKIDRTFLGPSTTAMRSAELIAAIVTIAKALGLSTVAEGIETVEQCDLVTKAGCDAAQGWLFARPMLLHELEHWLEARPVNLRT